MFIIRSTVVCYLHLRNKIILTLRQPLTSGTWTSTRLWQITKSWQIGTPRQMNLSNIRKAITGESWAWHILEASCHHKELQGANTQEERFNNSSSFLKSALIPFILYDYCRPVSCLDPLASRWPSVCHWSPINGEEYNRIGPAGDSDTCHKEKWYAKS